MTPEERAEIVGSVATLQGQLEALVVRGVRAASGDDLKQLTALHEDLGRIGAAYLGGRIGELIDHARTGDPKAAAALCGAQTALRVFDRVLTLHAARALLAAGEAEAEAEAPAADAPAADAPAADAAAPAPVALEDRAGLLPMLAELTQAVESLIATGLSTASAATRQKLDVSFKEASRRKLLRLGASLRYVNEELGRFLADASAFSSKRFAFFLHRSWLMARGLHEAIRGDDAASIARLLMTREPQVVRRFEAIVLGVAKRVQVDGGCSFDFRMRSLGGDVAAGTPVVWSCVFPPKKGVPAEAYLHLPQPQKFAPKLLLDRAVLTISECALSRGEPGGGARLLLGPRSTIVAGRKHADWAPHLQTDWAAIRARAAAHRVSPLELDVELQEEVVLRAWQVGAPSPRADDPGKIAYPLVADGRELVVLASRGPGDAELVGALDAFHKGGKGKSRVRVVKAAGAAQAAKAAKAGKAGQASAAAAASPTAAPPPPASPGPLFGLLHYERCQLVFQPLAIFHADGPEYLNISQDKISVASLVSSLDFK
jgi:hypothetical protein